MKKNPILVFCIAFLGGTMMFTNIAQAESVSGVDSTVYMELTPGDGVTNPVDPEDPDNPEVPNPIDPADPENEGTGNSGSLTIDYVCNIAFGSQKIGSGTVAYHAINKSPFIQVTDNRGTNEGWSLKATASEFSSETGSVLKGAVLSLKNGQVKSHSSNVSAPPVARDVVFDNTESKPVMIAEEDTGRGTWINVFSGTEGNNTNVQLAVLEGSAEANVEYNATITWELSSAPS